MNAKSKEAGDNSYRLSFKEFLDALGRIAIQMYQDPDDLGSSSRGPGSPLRQTMTKRAGMTTTMALRTGGGGIDAGEAVQAMVMQCKQAAPPQLESTHRVFPHKILM